MIIISYAYVFSVVSNEREGAIGKKIVITCQNVGLILPSKKPRVPNKTLLYNVNGCVQPRQMCAVMGPSGAGTNQCDAHYLVRFEIVLNELFNMNLL